MRLINLESYLMVSKGQIKGHCVVEFEGLTCEPVCFDILL